MGTISSILDYKSQWTYFKVKNHEHFNYHFCCCFFYLICNEIFWSATVVHIQPWWQCIYRYTTTSDQWPLHRIVPFQKQRLIWNGYQLTLKIVVFKHCCHFGILIQSSVAQLVTHRRLYLRQNAEMCVRPPHTPYFFSNMLLPSRNVTCVYCSTESFEAWLYLQYRCIVLQISKLLWGVTNPINIELILKIGVCGVY